jgi:Tfp pilus assembly protein PilV
MQHWRDDRGGEAGVSLIEAVIAVFILATAVVALIGGLATSIVATDSQSKNVKADAVVRSWADKLQAAPWVSCATKSTAAYSATSLGVSVPPKFQTPVIVSLDYWNGDSPATYGATCAAGGATDTAQRIKLSTYSTDARGGQQVQIVKRKP